MATKIKLLTILAALLIAAAGVMTFLSPILETQQTSRDL